MGLDKPSLHTVTGDQRRIFYLQRPAEFPVFAMEDANRMDCPGYPGLFGSVFR